MLEAIADVAARRDYALMVVTLAGARTVADAFAQLRDQGADGAIVLNEATTLLRETDPAAGLNLVVVDSPPDDRYSIVQTDHAGGAETAVKHLLAGGHATVNRKSTRLNSSH